VSGIRADKGFLSTYPKAYLTLLPLLGLAITATKASAQIVSAGDETATAVEAEDNRFDITGGQLSNDEANLFHSFEQFDLSAEQTANFETIPSVQNVIGSVRGGKASTIDGALQISGSSANLYLMNPAGVLMGPNAHLNLSGGFAATTATGVGFETGQFNAETADYKQLTGTPTGFRFDHERAGAVVNLGDLSVNTGEAIELIGGTVVNTGSLSAPEGTVTVAAVAGKSLVRIRQDNQLLSLEVEAAESNNPSSAITAQSIGSMLTGSGLDDATALVVAPDGTVRLGSGAIDESGGSAIASGSLSTVGETGGDINVLGDRVSSISATLDASGTNSGGLVRIGGDYQGNGTVANATHTLIDKNSVISANALETGNGGRTIIWADNTTQFYGAINARGGAIEGNGGFAEVSGKALLVAAGEVDLTASQGSLGTVLLDPENLVVTDELPIPPDDGTTSYFSSSYVESLSRQANVALEATNDFTIRSLSDGELRLDPDRSVTFKANSDGVGAGAFQMELNNSIRAERGNVVISGAGITVGTIDTSTTKEDLHGRASEVSGGSVELRSTLEINATEILTYGETDGSHAGNGGNVTLEALGGNVVVNNAIKTYSFAEDHESRSGGSIDIKASEGIFVGSSLGMGNVLDSSSTAVEYTSGEGGSVSLKADSGDIVIAGSINARTVAGTEQRTGSDWYEQSGGVVEIAARLGNIFVEDIATSAKTGRSNDGEGNAGNSGSVTITAGVDISTGLIDTSSTTLGDISGNGGAVSLVASRNLSTGAVTTDSVADSNSAEAGLIELKARTVDVEGGLSSLSVDSGERVYGNSNRVLLTGDIVRFGDGADSVRGASVNVAALDTSRNIDIGSSSNSGLALSITDAEIAAIDRNATGLFIGKGSTGTVQLNSSVTSASSSSRVPINIEGAQTLIGANESTTYEIKGQNLVNIIGSGDASTRLLDSANIRAGNGDDIFKITPGVNISRFGEISGGEGANVLDYRDFTVGLNLSLSGLSGLKVLAPNNVGQINRLTGIDADSSWRILGTNSGSVDNETGRVEFEGFSSLIGGDRKDEFIVEDTGSLTGEIVGGADIDTLSYTESSGPVEVDLGTARSTAVQIFSDIEAFIGNNQADSSIRGFGGNDEFKITGDRSGSINGLTFSQFAAVEGAGGDNTLNLNELSSGTSSRWTIDGSDRGSVDNVQFQNVGTLVGSDNDDSFAFIDSGTISGSLSGGSGDNTLDYSGYGSAIEVALSSSSATGLPSFADISTFIGSSKADSIRGTSGDDVFKITGDRTGEVAGITFFEIESIAGEQGQDTLDYSSYGSAVEFNLAGMNTATGLSAFSNIESIIGSSDIDKLIGADGDDTFNILGAGEGNINGDIDFFSVEKISGNKGSDTLSYSSYRTPVEISFLNNSATGIAEFSDIETVVGGSEDDRVIGSAGSDRFKIEALGAGSVNINNNSNTLRFSSIEKVAGGSGLDTLDYSRYSTAVEVDLETAQASGLSAFSEIESVIGSGASNDSIRGTSGDDTFEITEFGAGNVNQSLNFSDIEEIKGDLGFDTLDYSQYGSAVEVTLETFQATGLAKFDEIENFVGNGGDGVISGTAGDDVFEITGDRTGGINNLFFSNFRTLDGLGGDDRFVLSAPPTGNTNRWTVNQANGGLLSFEAASENSAAAPSVTFRNFEQIAGNADDNIFEISQNGSVKAISGSSGIDTISYSSIDSPVFVDLEAGTATGITDRFSEIERLIGSDYNNTLSGRDNGSRWTISGVDSGLAGSLSFMNFNRLLGKGGNDTFTFENNGLITGEIVGGSSDRNAQNRITSKIKNATWRLGGGENAGRLEGPDGTVISEFRQIQNLENDTTGGVHSVIFTRPNSQITGSINSGNSDLILLGDDINIGHNENDDLVGATIAGLGTLTIVSRTANVGIELGGTDSRGAALNITSGEIAAIQDSFSQVIIGDKTLTSSLLFKSDVRLGTGVTLQSRGDVDTGGYRLSADGPILVEGDRIMANAVDSRDRVSLIALEDIAAESVIAAGQGVDIASKTGRILVDGAIATRGQQLGNGIRLSAQKDIAVGDIRTDGGASSINISSTLGGITASGITTSSSLEAAIADASSGSVTLKSPENIEVEFIDTTGGGDRSTNAGFVRIETDQDFTATGYLPGTRTSLSAAGIENRTIDIFYGNESRPEKPFIVGQSSQNGAAGSIRAAIEIVSGDVPNGLSQGNITIVDRGYQLAEPRTPVAPLKIIEPLPEQSSAPEIAASNSSSSSRDVLRNLESGIGENFEDYLSLSEGGSGQALTLSEMQETLEAVKQTTGTTPALLYVYFVPDAASASAFSSESNRASELEDQLEVMLINPMGEPIRKRQWGVTRRQVEEASRELRLQVTSQFSTPRQYLAPAQQLYNWIVQPIAKELNNQQVDSIGFVMDAGLRTLPLAALHDGDQYLVENYSLGLLPTYSLTEFKAGSEAETDVRSARVLAMGASQFEDQPDLPAVDAEVGIITQELWEGDAFLNEDFVLENLQTQIKGQDYGVVHLATHASFEPGDLDKSYIQLWDEKLALNEIGQLGLDESNVSLIILSACNTALGDRASEYGFAGFAVTSGSQSAMASLWPVNDEGTLGFMAQFYGQLKQAPVKTEALRQAQMSMLRGEVGIEDGVIYGAKGKAIATLPSLAQSGRWDFSHPFFWSAFTMIGNPW